MQDRVCRKCGHEWIIHFVMNSGEQGCRTLLPSKKYDGSFYCDCAGFEGREDKYRVSLEIDFTATWPGSPTVEAAVRDDSTNAPRVVTLPRLEEDEKKRAKQWHRLAHRIGQLTGIIPDTMEE